MVFDSSNKLKTCLGRLDECGVGVEVLVALAVAMACRYVDGLVCVGVDHWFHVAGLGFGCFWQLLLLDLLLVMVAVALFVWSVVKWLHLVDFRFFIYKRVEAVVAIYLAKEMVLVLFLKNFAWQ